MNTYRATVRFDNLRERDPVAARSALQSRLLEAGIEDCQIVSLEQINRSRRHAPPGPPARLAPRIAPAEGAWRQQSNAGGVILIIAMAWAAWVIWSFLSGVLSVD